MGPKLFPARQTHEASAAVSRQHGVERAVFVQQNPDAIDAGAFHNDVVAVSNRQVFFYHQDAFAAPDALEECLQHAAGDLVLSFVRVPRAKVSLEDAIRSYLFNSQLLSLPGQDKMTLILPMEVAETPSARAYVDELLTFDGPIGDARYLDVRQSMRNGGGPACLRLRVVLTAREEAALGANVRLDDALADSLEDWIRRHYRDRLAPDDLGDPALMTEQRTALDELTTLLGLGSLYDFQRT
jgi:succinylarginine dihydrolase